jgi:hypothetical protein
MERYIGIPNVILKGKVIASAIGRKIPVCFGTAIFMAAGAMYDALEARTAKIKRLPMSSVIRWLK